MYVFWIFIYAVPQSVIYPVNEHNVTYINPEKLADSSDSFIDYDIVLDNENNCLSVNNGIFFLQFSKILYLVFIAFLTLEKQISVLDNLCSESVLDNPTMLSTQCANESIIYNTSIVNQASTSGVLSSNNKPSWSPIESSKLLKSTGKHQKLTSKIYFILILNNNI